MPIKKQSSYQPSARSSQALRGFLGLPQVPPWKIRDIPPRPYSGNPEEGARQPMVRRTDPFSREEVVAFFNLEQNSQAWHDARRLFVGASEIANLINQDATWNEYQLNYDFMNWLAGRIDQSPAHHCKNQLPLTIGHVQEDFGGESLAYAMEDLCGKRPEMRAVGTLVDQRVNHNLSASLDLWGPACPMDLGLLGIDPLESKEAHANRRVLNYELKVPMRKRYKGVFPKGYMAQTQQQMRIARTQNPEWLGCNINEISATYLAGTYLPIREIDGWKVTYDTEEPAVVDLYYTLPSVEFWDFAWPRINDFFAAYFAGETNYKCRLPTVDVDVPSVHVGEFEVPSISESFIDYRKFLPTHTEEYMAYCEENA